MPSNLERLRELKRKQDAANGNVPAQQATVFVAPKKDKPPTVKIDQPAKAKYLCGHDVHTHANCPACARASKASKRERYLKNKAAKAGEGDGAKSDQRLPDGAVFNVTYRAETTSWSGSLTIPGCPPFESNSSGVFNLLSRLDFL